LELRDLPTLNALLNTTATVLLLTGYRLVRQRRFDAHKKVMLAALAVSAAFLASYLIYHFNVGSVKFQKTGAIRIVYFAVLISHTILAAAAAPMALITVYRAWTNQLARHRALARITFPVWLYVSVTGVVVYWMLYRM